MEKSKKPFYKQWWFWVIMFLILLTISTKWKDSKPTPKDASEEIAEEQPQSFEDQAKAIIDSCKFEYSDLNIKRNGRSLDISLHYDTVSWDETSFVSDCITDYVNMCLDFYSMEDISNVTYTVYSDFQDKRGNESSEKAFSMNMIKGNFNQYNWNNLKSQLGTYQQIKDDSDLLYICTAISKNVDYEKVHYKGK